MVDFVLAVWLFLFVVVWEIFKWIAPIVVFVVALGLIFHVIDRVFGGIDRAHDDRMRDIVREELERKRDTE